MIETEANGDLSRPAQLATILAQNGMVLPAPLSLLLLANVQVTRRSPLVASEP